MLPAHEPQVLEYSFMPRYLVQLATVRSGCIL